MFISFILLRPKKKILLSFYKIFGHGVSVASQLLHHEFNLALL